MVCESHPSRKQVLFPLHLILGKRGFHGKTQRICLCPCTRGTHQTQWLALQICMKISWEQMRDICMQERWHRPFQILSERVLRRGEQISAQSIQRNCITRIKGSICGRPELGGFQKTQNHLSEKESTVNISRSNDHEAS